MQIGTISLGDFEIPASIMFGGQHRLAVHKSASGLRVIDDLGPDDSDIEFRGTFSGSQAESRARALDDLRLRGRPVWLSWNSFRYWVVVQTVRLDYRTSSWIHYQVSCLVVDQPGTGAINVPTAQAQLASDLTSATSAALSAGIDMSALAPILSAASGYPPGSAARAMAKNQVAAYRSQLDTVLAGALDANGAFPGPQPALSFASIVNGAGLLGKAANAAAYLGRVARSL